MNAVKYIVTEQTTGSQTTYGISAYDTLSAQTIIASVTDITADKEKLEGLVELCNREGLSPIHLYDVIEDFLCD